MRPERVFLRNLWAFDSRLFAIWNSRKQRWEIRRWDRARAGRTGTWLEAARHSQLIMTVCHRDENFYDVGYMPLDERTIFALKKARREGENPGVVARGIEESNERLERSFDETMGLVAKDVAIDAWRHCDTHSVY